MPRALGPLVVATVLLTPAAIIAGHTAPSPDGPTGARAVAIRGFRFEPAVVHASPGDTVVWTNHDIVPHDVSITAGGSSGTIEPGASWHLVLPAADSTDYLCAFHPNMTGSLVIRGSRLRKEIP